jgi:hypothetical protein
MEYRISEREIAVGWPVEGQFGGFCTHWYIGKWGFGAELGKQPVVLVDYDPCRNEVEVVVASSYRHRHGG